MASRNSLWNKFSLQKKLYLIFGLMALVIVLELLTLRYAMTNLTAVRAFVYGESVWSKAQKDSAYYLKRLSISKDDRDFEAYQKALFVPRECRIARLELYKDQPNIGLVRRGFINGKIHPDEVGPILHMIQTFDWLPHIQLALTTWKEADELLQEFERVAIDYREAVMTPSTSPQVISEYSRRLDEINLELGTAEDRFSDALQEGARWLENVVLISLLSLVVIVEVIGFLFVYFFGRALSQSLGRLITSARRIERRDFPGELPVTSQDEVGELTNSINQMGKTIEAYQSDLERKIAERTRALSEAIQTRDQFYSIASHELKTPVTAIQLTLQMMEKGLQATDSLNREKLLLQIGKAVELARKLNHLQDTLMDVTRINGGMFEMNMSKQDLMPIIRSSVDEARLSEQRASVDIVGPSECFASFDAVRMGQVISNLVKNALKYGSDTPVTVAVIEKEGHLQIRVSDKGPGIPQDQRDKIFEQFIRVNPDTGISGLGIGLYVSRIIMEAHGGSLVLESANEGATFLAVLPVASL